MKILLYENRKTDAMAWDASTPEAEEAAFRELFKLVDSQWQMFDHLAEDKMNREWQWLLKAREGEILPMRALLRSIQHEEYGNWGFITVQQPLTMVLS